MDDKRSDVLGLEYQSLRSDLVMRSGARFPPPYWPLDLAIPTPEEKPAF
jgi:hypothetical protein